MITMDYAKEQLYDKELAFIALKNEDSYETKDYQLETVLHRLHEDKHRFSGAVVAARTIGQADALFLSYGGIKELYADTISVPAIECFREHGVHVTYGELVDLLPAAEGSNAAELEQKCLDIHSSFEGYELLCSLFPVAP